MTTAIPRVLFLLVLMLAGCGNKQDSASELSKLGEDIKELQQATTQAVAGAAAAQKAAEEARRQAVEANQKTDQALADAKEMRRAIADLNETMNRMFKKVMTK